MFVFGICVWVVLQVLTCVVFRDVLSNGVLDGWSNDRNGESNNILSNQRWLSDRICNLSDIMFASNQKLDARFFNEVEDISYDIRDALLEDCDIGIKNDMIHKMQSQTS